MGAGDVIAAVVVVVVFCRHDSLAGVTSDRSWLLLGSWGEPWVLRLLEFGT